MGQYYRFDLNIGLSFLLGKWFGLWGVTFATVVAYLATDIWYDVLIYCRRFGLEALRGSRKKPFALPC